MTRLGPDNNFPLMWACAWAAAYQRVRESHDGGDPHRLARTLRRLDLAGKRLRAEWAEQSGFGTLESLPASPWHRNH